MSSNFKYGLTVSGVPIVGSGGNIPTSTGTYFFVDSNTGSDGPAMGQTSDLPLASIDYAIGLCTADKGDVIVCMPGHADAPTAAITADIAGITIVGLGVGRNRPSITAAHGTGTNVVSIEAANVTIENLRWVAGTTSSSNSVQIAIAATDFELSNCVVEMGAKNLIGVTFTSVASRFNIHDTVFLGTAANPDVAIDASGSGTANDWTVARCDFNFMNGSADLDLAGIRSTKPATGVTIRDCRFLGMTLTAIDFDSSATGLLENLSVFSLNATVDEMIDVAHMGAIGVKISDATKSGATIPATTSDA